MVNFHGFELLPTAEKLSALTFALTFYSKKRSSYKHIGRDLTIVF